MSGSSRELLLEIERTDETAILRILKIIRQAQDFRSTEELFRKIVDAIITIYKAYYHVSIFQLTEDRQSVRVDAVAGESAQEMKERFPQGYSQPISVGIAGEVCRTKKAYLCNDVSADPFFVPAMNSRTRSELCLPIFDARTCVGGLNIESDMVGTFTATDFYLFEVLAHALGSSITRDRLTRDVLDSIGALAVLGAAQAGAVVVVTPAGQVKYGNHRFLRYRNVPGLIAAITSAREGDSFAHPFGTPAGTPAGGAPAGGELRVHIRADRGGFRLAEVVE